MKMNPVVEPLKGGRKVDRTGTEEIDARQERSAYVGSTLSLSSERRQSAMDA